MALLILDTPRAGVGLNHRFFVASSKDCSEDLVLRYANQAREIAIGRDYLAVSRPAVQVSRGQTRDGVELLILAGIVTDDATRNTQLLARLESMLRSLQDSPPPADDTTVGLLISSHQLATFERELCSEPISAPYSRLSNRKRRLVTVTLLLMLPTFAAILIIMLARGRGPHQNQITPEPTPTGGYSESPQSKDGAADWSFLRKSQEWRSLSELTGLPRDGWDANTAKIWAGMLLSSADPLWQEMQEATPSELKQNRYVISLIDAVQAAHQEDAKSGAELVSRKWLGSHPPNDTQGIIDFWNALQDPRGGNTVSVKELKKILAKWEQILIEAQRTPPDGLTDELQAFADFKQRPTATESQKVQILLQSDLDRFLRIERFANSQSFSAAIAADRYGDNWQSSNWTDRLKNLADLGNSLRLPKRLRTLCAKLKSATSHQSH